MEAKRRLLGIGCVGMGVALTAAAAVWYPGPPPLHAAQDRSEIAVAPAPPPVRPDIRSSRSPVPSRAVASASATPPRPADENPGEKPSTTGQPAPRPSAPLPTAPVARGAIAADAPRPATAAAAIPTAPRPSVPRPSATGRRLHKDDSIAQANLLRQNPSRPMYPGTGESIVSQAALLRAADAQPGGPETMLDGNLLLIESHEVAQSAEAIDEFTRIVELCHAGIQAGVGTEAVQFANQLTSWAYNRRGEAYEALGESSKALVDFSAAVKHDPTRWRAVHNRGVSLAQAGHLREARDDFSRVIQLQPRYAKAYSNRGAISEQEGRLQEALKDFRRAAELEHSLPVAQAGIGRTLLKMGRLQEARIALDEAIQLDRENPAYLTSRGDAYAALGEYERALADYGKAIEVDPSFATAYRNGAWLLATCPDERFRDRDNAVIGAEKALELAFNERHLCLDTLAAAHANAGDFQQALAFAKEAIEEAPEHVRAFYEARQKMYERHQAYRTQPIQHAAFVEAAN